MGEARGLNDGSLELQVLHELSHARSNPAAIAQSVRGRLPHFKGKDYFPPDRGGKTAVVTKEGQAAVWDTLNYLEGKKPLLPLQDSCIAGLRLAAEDHLLDLGTRGAVGHEGADGSSSSQRMRRYGAWMGKCGECLWFGRAGATAQQIVEDLIVDDGVPSRGHRLGIFDEDYAVAGVRIGPHKTFGLCCVIEFASIYEDHEDKLVARITNGPPQLSASAPAARQGVKTQWTDLGQCPGCKETIHGGAVTEALGKKWHRDCFKCDAQCCQKALQGVPWKEHGRKPFCTDCYYEHFGETCGGCGLKIKGGVLKAVGKTWHQECFVCTDCKGPLESRFTTREGTPVCEKCSCTSRVPAAASKAPSSGFGGARAGSIGRIAPKAGQNSTAPASRMSGAGTLVLGGARARGGSVAKVAPAARKRVPITSAKKALDDLTMDYADLL